MAPRYPNNKIARPDDPPLAAQDIAAAVRPVFFQTEYEEFLYATHGGTMFLVKFRGRTYGITCGHVFQDFDFGQLVVTQQRDAQKGDKNAPVKGICYPSSPIDDAAETDIVDVCIVEFAEDMPADFFNGSAYLIDDKTAVTSEPGHRLLVAGVLKEKTTIVPPDIAIGYCSLELQDVGLGTSDPTLRMAIAEFNKPEFADITGISGSPVFDITASALCGMVVRGNMRGNRCTIHYLDIFDIRRLLEGVSSRAPKLYYKKSVAARTTPSPSWPNFLFAAVRASKL